MLREKPVNRRSFFGGLAGLICAPLAKAAPIIGLDYGVIPASSSASVSFDRLSESYDEYEIKEWARQLHQSLSFSDEE